MKHFAHTDVDPAAAKNPLLLIGTALRRQDDDEKPYTCANTG